jgi:three-Cys-motif partner protein
MFLLAFFRGGGEESGARDAVFSGKFRGKMPQVVGSDGLRARVNGEWAEAKLSFLDYYGPTALDATQRKVRRVYMDLFAGPGVNVTDPGGPEFEGGALRALRMRGGQSGVTFTDAALVNLNRLDHGALKERVTRLVESGECLAPPDRIDIRRADANECLPELLSKFHRLDYILSFADIEAPKQWPWTSVQALKAQGHQSVDLYMLFPLEMGINRLLAYEEADRERHGPVLTRFFGNDRWRELVGRRPTSAQAAEFRTALEELYLSQLRGLWRYADKVMNVRLRANQGLYRMLFASDHEAGQRIAEWAKRRASSISQTSLFP